MPASYAFSVATQVPDTGRATENGSGGRAGTFLPGR
jgi:hypothetical protein